MKVLPLAGLAFAAAFGIQTLSAVTITFDTASDFDNNFYKGTGNGNANLLFSEPNLDIRYGATANTPAGVIYNSNTTPPTNPGEGGTALNPPFNTFGNLTMEAAFSVNGNNNASTGLGLYFNLANDLTGGYALLLRPSGSTNGGGDADIRLFNGPPSPTTNASIGALGSQIGGVFSVISTSSLDLNSTFIFRITTQNVGSNLLLTGTMLDNAGTQIGDQFSTTITGAAGSGQVGIRFGAISGATVSVSSFSVIPEPAVVGLVLLGLTVVLFRIPRTRKC